MIKDPSEEQLQNLKLNVTLKDGREFLGCDTTPNPMGKYDRVVAIWQNEAVLILPLSEVKEVAMYFEP
jgi:hypothetical protein